MKVLVINAGNSSLKYQLMDPATCEMFAKRLCGRIGINDRLTHKVPTKDVKCGSEIPMSIHSKTIQIMPDALLGAGYGMIKSVSEIDAVGHRVVRGDEKFAFSVCITGEVMAAPEECVPPTSLRNLASIVGVRTCEKVMPGVPIVGVFGAAFRQTMPAKSHIYALPYEFYRQDRVRRYGSHGTSHHHISTRTTAMSGKPIEKLRIIICHLGNGSSVAAMDGGKSVDTSVGFTPLAGIPMGTRAGDLDVGILEYLIGKHGYDMKEMTITLNKKPGALGIFGMSPNSRDLENAAKEGNRQAELALETFQYSVKKLVGAYATAMGRMDVIVSTADVGKDGATTYVAMTSGLEFMGVKMDTEANNVRGKETAISSADSKVKILLIPTDEKLMIAMDAVEIIGK